MLQGDNQKIIYAVLSTSYIPRQRADLNEIQFTIHSLFDIKPPPLYRVYLSNYHTK